MQSYVQCWGRLVSRGAAGARWGRRGQQRLAGVRTTASSNTSEPVEGSDAPPRPARHIERLLPGHDDFSERHIGPRDAEKQEMLQTVGLSSIDELIDKTIPGNIRLRRPLKMDDPIL